MPSSMEAEAGEDDLDARQPPLEATGIPLTPTDLELGRCRLRYLVAQGGMASVYLAQLAGVAGFERWVAVKVVHPHLANDQRFVRMLLDEARLTARIQHPNVCSVIDFGRDGSTCFLVMEYMHGESLASALRRGSRSGGIPWPLAVRMVIEGARGLHAAHELRDAAGRTLGLVHRDVSPQNLFVLYEGVTKVLDFGVAQARDKLEKTASGEVKGKLAYMSPEQLLGQEVDRRTDVWALGVVLWEALAGTRLFRGKSDGETVQRVLNAEVVRPSRGARRSTSPIPKEIEAIVLRALARDPAARTATAAELADALEDALHGSGARAGQKEVAAWMREIFADRRALREEMMRKQVPAGIVPEVELETGRTQVTPGREGVAAHVAAIERLDDDASAVRPTPAPSSPRASQATVRASLAIGFVVVALASMLALGFHLGARGRGAVTSPVSEDALPPASPQALEVLPPVPSFAPDAVPPEPQVPAEPAVAALPTDPGEEVSPTGERAEGSEASEPETTPAASIGDARAATTRTEDRAPPARGRAREREVVEMGAINVIAIPPARIYLRGRLLGETPLRAVPVPAGVVELEARPVDGEGPVRRVPVTVRAGETARVSIR